ncbi:hypothetical protein [Polaribacter butkevichii]|uniref:Uncharacterized protein n=1 Tax=Polaribacter butkevichii TaxID=218490 RepID=A0A2P6C857_9FLAO|nr:hypothetical protein [Polaribacter butkevichii]PQJ69118.1 hypothetical protein BTO14_13895 [Polaribacter butkevichii]
MDIADQLTVLYKQIDIIVKRVRAFNSNNQLIIDSFVINLYSEEISQLKRKIVLEKGIQYVFKENNLEIRFSEEYLK